MCEVAIEVASTGVGCVSTRLAERAGVRGGDRVAFDARGQLVRSRMAPARLAAWRAPVDINGASLEELISLIGIGPKLAARIVAARPFHSVAELARVPGIGVKKFAQLRDRLTLADRFR
jgi:competence ComEA-like helix-hairpin-helix protein